MIGEEPGLTGVPFQDAYVGAVGEHLARRWGLDIPAWADDAQRFLDEPHFPNSWNSRSRFSCATAPLPSAAA